MQFPAAPDHTQSHVDYVGEVIGSVAARAGSPSGYRIVEQAPWLRHFTARFEPLSSSSGVGAHPT
jgi:tryptophanase